MTVKQISTNWLALAQTPCFVLAMPKKERCTKRVVFYLTPSEYRRADKAREKIPSFRTVNEYAASALLCAVTNDLGIPTGK